MQSIMRGARDVEACAEGPEAEYCCHLAKLSVVEVGDIDCWVWS